MSGRAPPTLTAPPQNDHTAVAGRSPNLPAWTPARFPGNRDPRPRGSHSRSPPTEPVAPGRFPTRSPASGAGRPDDPAWARPALLGLLVATGGALPVGPRCARLGATPSTPPRRRPVRRAGRRSSSAPRTPPTRSPSTRPPLSLWVMALSVRIFGLSSWSILVPQALMGVADRRAAVRDRAPARFAPAAGLIAGAVLALTPVAVLMFRFNNPDALLVLLLVGAAATPRCERSRTASTRWLVLAGVLVGLGFLTKMLQALLVVPALRAGLPGRRADAAAAAHRRTCSSAGLALVVAAGWWVAIVELVPGRVPAVHRRLAEQHDPRAHPRLQRPRPADRQRDRQRRRRRRRAGGGNWGATGLDPAVRRRDRRPDRLAAAGRAGAAGRRPGSALGRAPRTDRRRAALLVWGGWLRRHRRSTSASWQGIFHAYYTVALAPAIGALVGIGRRGAVAAPRDAGATGVLARRRGRAAPRCWSFVLLAPQRDWHAVAALASCWSCGLVAAARACWPAAGLPRRARRRRVARRAGRRARPARRPYAVDTAATAAHRLDPDRRARRSPARRPGGGPGGGPAGLGGRRTAGSRRGPAARRPAAARATGRRHAAAPAAAAAAWAVCSTAATPSAAVIGAAAGGRRPLHLGRRRRSARNTAAGYQLATERAGDGDRWLQRQRPVADAGAVPGSTSPPGEIHYFIGGGRRSAAARAGGSNGRSEIAAWVAANFTATTVGGVTVYDLPGAGSS